VFCSVAENVLHKLLPFDRFVEIHGVDGDEPKRIVEEGHGEDDCGDKRRGVECAECHPYLGKRDGEKDESDCANRYCDGFCCLHEGPAQDDGKDECGHAYKSGPVAYSCDDRDIDNHQWRRNGVRDPPSRGCAPQLKVRDVFFKKDEVQNV